MPLLPYYSRNYRESPLTKFSLSKGSFQKLMDNLYLRDVAFRGCSERIAMTQSPLRIQRRLPKSYGILWRVRYEDNIHDEAQKIQNIDGCFWCNNVVRWMQSCIMTFFDRLGRMTLWMPMIVPYSRPSIACI